MLKALRIRNETEEYLLFKKVDQRKLSDATKKVIRYIETDDVTLTNKLAMAAALWVTKHVGVKKSKKKRRREKRAMVEKKN